MNKLSHPDIGIQFSDPSKIPYDIICNGFSMKEVIQNILDKYLPLKASQEISEEIKEALAIKLRLKQGI